MPRIWRAARHDDRPGKAAARATRDATAAAIASLEVNLANAKVELGRQQHLEQAGYPTEEALDQAIAEGTACLLAAQEPAGFWVHELEADVVLELGPPPIVNPAGPVAWARQAVARTLGAQALAGHAGAYLAARAHPGPVTFPLAGPGWLPRSMRPRKACGPSLSSMRPSAARRGPAR